MKASRFAFGWIIIAVLSTSPLHGQSLKDRLKKAIKVEPGTIKVGDSTLTKSSGRNVPPERFTVPSTTLAHPDFMGLAVGTATIQQGRNILKQPQYNLKIFEANTILATHEVKRPDGGHETAIPGTDFISTITGETISTFGDCGYRKNCQKIQLTFSEPPSAGVLIAAEREIKYIRTQGPTVDAVLAPFIAKLGPPRERLDTTTGGQNVEGTVRLLLVWDWSADGKVIPTSKIERPADGSPDRSTWCDGLNPITTVNNHALGVGCMARAVLEVYHANNLVALQRFYAVDAATSYHLQERTASYVADRVESYKACERDRAARRGVSSEFGDPVASTTEKKSVRTPTATSDTSCWAIKTAK